MKTFLVVVAALTFATSLSAESIGTLKPTGRVNDFANALDAPSRVKLEQACREIDERVHAQIVVVTVNTLDGADIYDYSKNLFWKWGIGIKGINRGVLILFAIQDHRYRITVGSGLDSILKEGNVAAFGLEAVPFLKRSDYGSAALLMTSRVARVIANDAGVALSDFEPPALQSPTERAAYTALQAQPVGPTTENNTGLILLIVFGAIVFAGYLVIQYGKRRSYRSAGITSDTNDDVYVASRSTSIFTNPATTVSIWNSADTSSNDSSSFGSNDSGGSFSGSDTSNSCGGGDTSGGGAGGNW